MCATKYRHLIYSKYSTLTVYYKVQTEELHFPLRTEDIVLRLFFTQKSLEVNLVCIPLWPKSNMRLCDEEGRKSLKFAALCFPGTYFLSGQQLVKGMFHSSMQTFQTFGGWDSVYLPRPGNDLTFLRQPLFPLTQLGHWQKRSSFQVEKNSGAYLWFGVFFDLCAAKSLRRGECKESNWTLVCRGVHRVKIAETKLRWTWQE